jgi:hypothetical protein
MNFCSSAASSSSRLVSGTYTETMALDVTAPWKLKNGSVGRQPPLGTADRMLADPSTVLENATSTLPGPVGTGAVKMLVTLPADAGRMMGPNTVTAWQRVEVFVATHGMI